MKNSWKNKTSSFLKAKTLVSKSGKILNSSLENRNLKDFESLLESKQKLLKEQKIRTQNASFNLTTYFRNKKVVAFHRIIKAKSDKKMNLAAVKIQKVLRGFLIRKSTLRIRSELEKRLMIGKIFEIKQTVDSLFYLNKFTETVRNI